MAGIRVLIVDDDPIAFERLQTAFDADAEAFELANAISGPRALGLAASSPPDAVIVDGALDGMDGYAFTAELKGDAGPGRHPRDHHGPRAQRGARAARPPGGRLRSRWPRTASRSASSRRSSPWAASPAARRAGRARPAPIPGVVGGSRAGRPPHRSIPQPRRRPAPSPEARRAGSPVRGGRAGGSVTRRRRPGAASRASRRLRVRARVHSRRPGHGAESGPMAEPAPARRRPRTCRTCPTSTTCSG